MVKLVTTHLKGRKPDSVLAFFEREKVGIVLDVRWWAEYPLYFSPFARDEEDFLSFSTSLRKQGILYYYEQFLGNPTKLRKQFDFPEDWASMKEKYKDYIKTNDCARVTFKKYVRLLKNKWKAETVALLCYCPTTDKRLCHRFWLKELFEDSLS